MDVITQSFNRRALWLLLGGGVGSLAIMVGTLFNEVPEPERSWAGDGYSRSALGHHALVALLRRLDVPVVRSRWRSGERSGRGAVLVIADPGGLHREGPDSTLGRLLRGLRGAEAQGTGRGRTRPIPTVLILPKWTAQPDTQETGFVSSLSWVPTSAVEAVLRLAGGTGRVVRPAQRSDEMSWTHAWTAEDPTIDSPQLIKGGLEPLLASDDGILIGKMVGPAGQPLIVISDPDLAANGGIHRGANAFLVTKAILTHRSGGSPVIFDETVHGHAKHPNLWRELLRFPLSLVTMSVLFLMFTLLWVAVCRFGAPRPWVNVGHDASFLIDNTAGLMAMGGRPVHTLERYVTDMVDQVGEALHAPSTLSPDALRGWLDRHAEHRGLPHRVQPLYQALMDLYARTRRIRTRRVLQIARRVHRWRQEMLDESRSVA